jgi:hypothetical protein
VPNEVFASVEALKREAPERTAVERPTRPPQPNLLAELVEHLSGA